MKRWMKAVPLVVFLLLAGVLYKGLFLKPDALPSALLGKPFPAFSLPAVQGGGTVTEADLIGRPALVNVWGTWCPSCKIEHPFLNQLAEQGVLIHGIDYKDDPAAAQAWLRDFHDPYTLNVRDDAGTLGLNLGVYGAPETFLIDAQGIIRHRHVGVIDATVWREQLAPLYQALVEEARP